MPDNKKIEVGLTVRDEATQKIKSFRAAMNDVNQGVKDQLKPLLQLRQTWMRVAGVWAVTAGLTLKVASEMGRLKDEIKGLDSLSIKLGISTETLSKKMYGFNIASSNARIGANSAASGVAALKNAWRHFLSGMNSAVGGARVWDRALQLQREEEGPSTNLKVRRKYLDQARAELEAQQRKQLENSDSALTLKADVLDQTSKLSMPAMAYRKQQIEMQKVFLFGGGVDSDTVTEWYQQKEREMYRERAQVMSKNQAAELAANGDTIAALKVQQEQAYTDFNQVWGDDGEVLKSFKAGQDAQLKQARATQLGLKATNKEIADDFMKGYIDESKAALTDFYDGFLSGEISNAKDIIRSFGDALRRNFAEALAEMTARWILFRGMLGEQSQSSGKGGGLMGILSGVASLFSLGAGGGGGASLSAGSTGMSGFDWIGPTPGSYHRGGIVRAHKGLNLASDEVPIIAQTGERVLSREENRRYSGGGGGGAPTIVINNYITAMDDKSIREKLAEHGDIYVGAYVRDILGNGNARSVSRKYGR